MSTIDGDWTYDYDGDGQLTHAVFVSSNPAISNQDLTYNYDAVGNRTSTIINGVRTNYVPNNLNQYTSVGGVAYQYDADGNLTFDGLRNYSYDIQSRLVRVTEPEGVTEYEYNAIGNRIATVTSSGEKTEYLLDPTGLVNIFGEIDGSGSPIAHYPRGHGLALKYSAAGDRSFYDFDATGSTSALTDTSGAVQNRYGYVPFGDTLFATETTENHFEFVGQFGVTREGNGLDFMRARFLSRGLGVFTSPALDEPGLADI